jgi:hypothetical protein
MHLVFFSWRQLLLVSTTGAYGNCGWCHNYNKIARTSFSDEMEPSPTPIWTGLGLLLTPIILFFPGLEVTWPCDIFLWGYIEDYVYMPSAPRDLPQLQQRIVEAVAALDRKMFQHVWQEVHHSLDVSHFPLHQRWTYWAPVRQDRDCDCLTICSHVSCCDQHAYCATELVNPGET